MEKVIKIKYNGNRHPRTVNLRGGGKISFFDNRNVIALQEYDALYLLKFNSRINPEKWEFTIDGIIDNAKQATGQEVKVSWPAPEIEKIDKRTKEYKKQSDKGDR